MQHHAPISQLILETLQHQGLLVRDHPGGLLLLLHIIHQVGARIIAESRHSRRVGS